MKRPQLAYVTIFAKTDHSGQMFDTEILVLCCSVCIALQNGAVRIAIMHTVPELRESRTKVYERLINDC